MNAVHRLGLFLAIWTAFSTAAARTWQPFIENGRWGFVDARGDWKIPPRFERAPFAFEKEWVPVLDGKRWGLLGRDGTWLVEPLFENFWPFQDGKFLVVSVGKKQGLLDGATGQFVLPADYDELCVSDGSVWVRDGDRLGLLGFDGEWIRKPSLPWPRARPMPQPLNSDEVAWFTQRDKWGVLSSQGEILFPARFGSHELHPRECEAWAHPEGVDFQNGRAWVKDGGKYLLITSEGDVLAEHAFTNVQQWSDKACIYTIERKAPVGSRAGAAEILTGIVDWNGNLALPAAVREIQPVQEGIAVVSDFYEFQKTDGDWDGEWRKGCVDEAGGIVVPMGRYDGIGTMSEGLADAWRSTGGHISRPEAGFIDRDGKEVVPFRYRDAENFSDGLAAVSLARPGTSSSYVRDRYYGFIDRSEAMVIPPDFEHVTPFCRGRAWVAPRNTWRGSRVTSKWAMVDRSGKRLTDWAYDPPESGNDYRFAELPASERLARLRWRDDLAVLARDRKLGLATSDGEILVEPTFSQIGEFHDGLAKVSIWTGKEYLHGFIDRSGKVAIPVEFTDAMDFRHGAAWVTRRKHGKSGWIDNGWVLIDRSGKALTSPLLRPSWVFYPAVDLTSGPPEFLDGIAAAAEAEDYDPYRPDAASTTSWGYIERGGKRIIWQNPTETP